MEDKYLEQLDKKRRRRQLWQRVLAVLMCVTVFITTYALILPAVTLDTSDPSLPHIDWGAITWDEENRTIESASISLDAKKKTTYSLQYKDANNTSWTKTNPELNFQTTKDFPDGDHVELFSASQIASLIANADLSTYFRVKWGDDNNGGSTVPYNLIDLLEEIKPNFRDWLANDYVNELGHTKQPTTKEEYFEAFDVFYDIPRVDLTVTEQNYSGETISASVTVDSSESFNYQWFYLNESTGVWQEIPGESGNTISDVSTVLPTYGAYLRCRITDEDDNFVANSKTEFVNPKDYDFREAIGLINTGLGLQTYPGNGSSTHDLRLDGELFNKAFYFTQSALNPDVPFYDAASYRYLLCKTYVRAKDNGATDTDAITEVRNVWNRYLYDLFDPDSTLMDNIGYGYPTADTYGDGTLSWPKSANDSFHGGIQPVVNDLNWSFVENGVDYTNFISNMYKYATADAAGDANAERKYTIDIVADGQAKARAPLALIFQIQTSWQMFDMNHANAVKIDGKSDGTSVGSLGRIDAMATLYDIKWAILDYLDYIEEAYPGNNLVIGVTEVRHTTSDSMFVGEDKLGEDLYVTNDMDVLRRALYNWDIFGNCEHVHYTTTAIENAVENLVSNLYGWKDFYKNDIAYNDIRKVGVVVGGATENSSDDNGYGCPVTWSSFQTAGFNSVYGIRTDEGEPRNNAGVMSWLDIPVNNGTTPFKDGVGDAFTKKYVATSREDFFESLREIADREFRVGGIEVKALDKTVEDVYIHDTVKPEFKVDYDKPVIASILRKDGTKMYGVEIRFTNGGYTVTQIAYDESGAETGRLDLTGSATLTEVPAYDLANGEKSKLVLTFEQPQSISVDITEYPEGRAPWDDLEEGQTVGEPTIRHEDRDYTSHNVLTITEYNDKRTDVNFVYDVLYNTTKAELNFGIVAREDYIGSNNVYTNDDLAYSGYTHTRTVTDPDTHIQSTVVDDYTVYCYDRPEVNVPIEFTTVNGGSVIVSAGTEVDLESLDNGVIPADVFDRLNKGYEQINGTLDIVWVEPDGTERVIGSVHYTDGKADAAVPSLSDVYRFLVEGDYSAELRLTFRPDPVENNGNFHDDKTLEKVNRKRRSGYVSIKVFGSDATTEVFVRKVWKGTPAYSSVKFKLVNQHGDYYTGVGSDPIEYAITESADWQILIPDLPAVVNGEVQTYSAVELSLPNYVSKVTTSESVTYTYSGTMNVEFTPTKAMSGSQYLRVTYVYNGQEYVRYVPNGSALSLAADVPYSFLLENLLVGDDGVAGTGYIKRIDYVDSVDSESSYMSFIGPDYHPFSCVLSQVGFLSLDLTAPSKLNKNNSFVITVLDSQNNVYTFSVENKNDINAGVQKTLDLGTVPAGNGPYTVTSVTYGSTTIGSVTLHEGLCKPVLTFTAPSDQKLEKDSTLTVVLEDQNQQYSLSYTLTQEIAAGGSSTVTFNQYLPEGEYTVVSAECTKGNKTYYPTVDSVDLQRFYQMFASMDSPSDIPAGTAIRVTYTENGVVQTFDATTDTNIGAGETLVLKNPAILTASGGEYVVTDFSKVSGDKNKTYVPYYQPLATETETYSVLESSSVSSDIEIVNTPNIPLPSTFGRSPAGFVIAGIALMLIPIIYGGILRRRHERRDAEE